MREPHLPYHSIPAQRLTVYLNVTDRVRRRSLASELLERVRHAKLAGATVFHAVEGYGASGQVHRTRAFQDDEPVSLVVVETPERVAAFVEANQDLLADLLIAVDEVELLQFTEPS